MTKHVRKKRKFKLPCFLYETILIETCGVFDMEEKIIQCK